MSSTLTQQKLSPCPFCEGPPVPIVVKYPNGGVFPDSEIEAADDGLMIRAFVFCHECGAKGPNVEGFVFSRQDCHEHEDEAVRLWQGRDARHRSLYDGGDRDRLNLYPRDDDLEHRKRQRR